MLRLYGLPILKTSTVVYTYGTEHETPRKNPLPKKERKKNRKYIIIKQS